MNFSVNDLQRMCAKVGIRLDDHAKVVMPETADREAYACAIRALMSLERQTAVFARFAIGDLVAATPGIEGARKAWCIQEFGPEIGKNAMSFYWVAQNWPSALRDVSWGWTWFRALARLPEEVKRQYIHRFKQKAVTYGVMRSEVDTMMGRNQITVGNLGQGTDLPDSTCIASSVYVESRKQAEQFLRCTATKSDLLALCNVAAQRVLDFADEEESQEEE